MNIEDDPSKASQPIRNRKKGIVLTFEKANHAKILVVKDNLN